MKSESFNNFEVYLDENNKLIGFKGDSLIGSKKIWVDTKNGEGYGEVLEWSKGLVNYLSSKFRLKGFDHQDMRQHILMRLLEGIPKYDPRKQVKLSTFLQLRTSRLLINDIRDENILARNATALNTVRCVYKCECGTDNEIMRGVKDHKNSLSCGKCGKTISALHRNMNGSQEIQSFSVNPFLNEEESSATSYSEEHDSCIDIKNWIKEEDNTTAQLVDLICFQDYSVSSAAKKLGLTNTWADIKLKRLSKNPKVRDLLGR